VEDARMGRMPIEEKLDRQLKFHRIEWRIQRIGWIVVAMLLVLALAGLFGNGPLSHAHADGPTGRIDYERFVRNGSPAQLVVTPSGSRGVSRIEITAAYLEAVRIERITPEPTAVRMQGERLLYEFDAVAPGAAISFHIDPQQLWRHTAEVTIDGGAPLRIWQLTYP
jgi:hypothetical protein